ncbi:MAG: HK97 gp10 family phage protein [Candidatus Omnitrophota bacterium]|jgi:hypothetical protein
MRAINWNPKAADKQIYANAMDRLEAAGKIVLERARSLCPVGTESRPMYKTGKYAGQPWTARDAGALKKTIRVVRKYGDENLNVWVIAGNKNVYYAHIVEFYTPFLRPALHGSKSEIVTVIKQGTMKGGPSYTAKGGTF